MKAKLSLLILMLVSLLTNKLTAQKNNNNASVDKKTSVFPIRESKTTPYSKEVSTINLGNSLTLFSLFFNSQTLLSYDSIANTVVFVHRGDGTTHPSGVIVADYSKDGGDTWTNNSIILSDDRVSNKSNGGRYPNIALLNKKSSDPNNLIIVSVGVTAGNNDIGRSYFAHTYRSSKKLDNTAGKTTYTANDYMATIGTGKGTPNDFTGGSGLFSTNDSTVFSVGTSINISTDDSKDTLSYRNYYVWKGVITPEDTLKWTMVKKLTPKTYFPKTIAGPLAMISPKLNMAFGPSGKVGYLVGLGLFKSSIYPTHNNRKFYIAKTTDYGQTWKHIGYPRLESIPLIKNNLLNIGGTSLKRAAPDGDFDVIVDAKDSLHIFCDIAGQRSEHTDSLGYRYLAPLHHKYYDITLVDTSKTGFSAYLIDSAEVIDYTWYDDPNSTIDGVYTGRFNLSRTTDGKKIFYTWTDSDPEKSADIPLPSQLIPYRRRSLPDALIVARDMITGKWAKAKVATANTDASEAFAYGFTSPVIITNKTTADYKYEIPMGYVEHESSSLGIIQIKYISDIGFNESEFTYDKPTNNTFKGVFNPEKINLAVNIYPNPNTGIFTIKTGTIDNYSVQVIDILGRTVFEKNANATNSIKVDLSTFQKGIYFISLHTNKGFASNKVMIK